MSGELHVRVQAPLHERDAGSGFRVVGNIYPTGGPREAASASAAQREVLLPVGAGVSPAVFPVAPGRYLVEASLPSGELLCEEVILEMITFGRVYSRIEFY